jgi:hypothetical protein
VVAIGAYNEAIIELPATGQSVLDIDPSWGCSGAFAPCLIEKFKQVLAHNVQIMANGPELREGLKTSRVVRLCFLRADACDASE